MKRRAICRTVRKQIRERWPQCAYCRREYGNRYDEHFTIDHAVPLSKGGRDHPDNFIGCCRACNWSKRDRSPGEWAAEILAAAALCPVGWAGGLVSPLEV